MTESIKPRLCGLAVVAMTAVSVTAAENDSRVFEMRTYYAAPEKLDDLHARFRNHTCKLFEKHGMANVGYWVPIENKESKLIYLLAHKSVEAKQKSWNAFLADPDWQKAFKQSEQNGTLVAKIETTLFAATDYSPRISPTKAGKRVFELRDYTASPGNLDRLNARFRDHTCKLFEKHGMTNIGYWTPMAGQTGHAVRLLYLLAHESPEAAKESFAAFRNDPGWIAARKASEAEAGGPLTAKDGVKSTFLLATDYSPIR